MSTVFDSNNRSDHTKNTAFLDPSGGVSIQRYDTLKYKQFDKLTDKQLGFFWRPEEVDILRDAKDFKDLTAHEQHIFTSNLKRQILLDSVQGRAPTAAIRRRNARKRRAGDAAAALSARRPERATRYDGRS